MLKLNFTTIKIFLEDIETDNILVLNKNSSDFIGYLYDDYKVKSLCLMIQRIVTYVKIYDGCK